MWGLVLGQWSLCREWLAFVEAQKVKVVSHDLWLQVLDFSRDVGDDLKGYDAEGAWPVILDEFVDHIRASKRKT